MNTNNMFPGATIFQYDYLNDDVGLVMSGADLLNDKVGWKLPRKLREALADKSNKWVVLMNPPYAEAGDGVGSGTTKKGVSTTLIKERMPDLGLCVREIFIQFLYRIHKELPQAVIGMYATFKYVNAPGFELFRNGIFQAEYKGGFLFPSSAFQGTKGQWPVSFLVWDLSKKIPLEQIITDVYDFEED
jgi:hypothetical protein